MKRLLIYILDVLNVLLVCYFILEILKDANIFPEFSFNQVLGLMYIALFFKIPTKHQMYSFETITKETKPKTDDYLKYVFVKTGIILILYGTYLLLNIFI